MEKRNTTDELVKAVENFNSCVKECIENDLEIKATLNELGLQVLVYDGDSIFHEEEG